jgi:hypothetical protein
MDEAMAKVKVTKDVIIHPDQTVNVRYPAGFEGTVPHAHIELLRQANACEQTEDPSLKPKSLVDKIIG